MTAPGTSQALRACQKVTPGAAARHAAAAWEMAALHGWETVRASIPRSTFYRALRILRAAGLPVPEPRGQAARPGTKAAAAQESQTGTTSTARDLQSAGGLLGMPGRRFQLVDELAGGEPPGTRGTVYAVMFRANRWRVSFELDPWPGMVEEVDLGRFARCTAWLSDDGDASTS